MACTIQDFDAVDFERLSREEVKDYLLVLVDKHVDARQSYKSLKKDPTKNLEAWLGEESGVPLTVVTMQADGLTVDDFRAFFKPDVWPANVSKVDAVVTCRRMEHEVGESCYIMSQHIKTPFMVANRCCIVAVYNIELPDGGFIHLVTSKGNKGIAEESKEVIAKDVLSHTIVGYHKIEPCAVGVGCTITNVMCLDVAGDLPGFVKEKITVANSQGVETLVKLLQKQKKGREG